MQNDKIAIFIDGNNLYHRLKEIPLTSPRSSLDYNALALLLAGREKIVARRYYIGAVREEAGNPRSSKLMAAQQRFVSKLQREKWAVVFGQLLKTGDSYHEKGVDVQIAVDLLVGAYEDLYDRAVLVSSDSDLIPALTKVRAKGKKVEYVGFSHAPSHALITNSDIRRLLRIEEIESLCAER